MGGYIFFFLNMEFMRRCILTFLFFLFYGLGEDRRLGIIVWVEALGGRSCTICYNVLLFCSFSFSFFFFFIYRLYYHSIITNWYNIHKNPKSRSTLLHCITIASALSCMLPPPLKTYQHFGLKLCYSLPTSPLARLLISASWEMPPKCYTSQPSGL